MKYRVVSLTESHGGNGFRVETDWVTSFEEADQHRANMALHQSREGTTEFIIQVEKV